jgi:hypothetical protein
MPKIWKNNRRDIADLKRCLRVGDVVYTVRKISGHVAPYEDSKLYAAHEFTHHSADPARQVGAPLGNGHEAILDEAEIRGMEKLAAQTSNPRNRRRPGSWRV